MAHHYQRHGRGAAAQPPRGHWRMQRVAAAGVRCPVWPGRHQPHRALRSCTAQRTPCWQRRALTRQPGAPCCPMWSTRGRGWRIGTRAARGRRGHVVAQTPRRQRQWQRPTTLTSALTSRIVPYCHHNGEFLLAARHFSPLGAANSQFWLRTCLRSILSRAKNNDNITMMDTKFNILVKSLVI